MRIIIINKKQVFLLQAVLEEKIHTSLDIDYRNDLYEIKKKLGKIIYSQNY